MEIDVAGAAAQAVEVEFLAVAGAGSGAFVCFEIFAFDSGAAAGAQGAVVLVVVLRAVGAIAEDVEVVCCERRAALEADKASAVIAACETAVGR